MKKMKFVLAAMLLTLALILTACNFNTPSDTSDTDDSETTEIIEATDTQPPETDPTDTTESETNPLETEPVVVDAPIGDVQVFKSDGTAVEGVQAVVAGECILIKLPLNLSEAALKDMTVSLMLLDGTVMEPAVMDLTGECAVEIPMQDGGTMTCTVTSERESYGLPIIRVNTVDAEPIIDKEKYIEGTISIDGVEYEMKIKGRGNSSWTTFPKKSYRVKLTEKESLFGLEKNKNWIFACNYTDKTLIRNCVANAIAASLDGLEFTPTHFLVNYYLNGEYMGVYTFGDRIEDGSGRLDLGDPVVGENGVEDVGFLVEMGWDYYSENIYNKDYFDSEYAFRMYVKEPEITEANSPEFLIVKKYILDMERAIVNNDGWEDYIDVDSWIDWFIVNELTFNTESSFYRSCYFWRPVGGKVNMGPVWDFDMAFGNHWADLRGYDGWCTTESTYQYISTNWMNFLMTYPEFTDRLVERWNEVKDDLLDIALSAVDSYSASLEGSQQQNFDRWDIMEEQIGEAFVNGKIYNTYDKQVEYLRDFIETRWEYIDQRLNSDEYSPKQEAE